MHPAYRHSRASWLPSVVMFSIENECFLSIGQADENGGSVIGCSFLTVAF